MTVKEYITGKMSTFEINVSGADLLAMLLPYPAISDDSTEVDADNMNVCNMAITNFIPELMLRATSVNESGFSMSWDVGAVKDYYSMMCIKYGMEDILSDKPKIEIL